MAPWLGFGLFYKIYYPINWERFNMCITAEGDMNVALRILSQMRFQFIHCISECCFQIYLMLVGKHDHRP